MYTPKSLGRVLARWVNRDRRLDLGGTGQGRSGRLCRSLYSPSDPPQECVRELS